jgi:hypothetical protein
MLDLPKDLKEFTGLLNSHDVHYLVVGGYAVAFHGNPRMTGDIDFTANKAASGRPKDLADLAALS